MEKHEYSKSTQYKVGDTTTIVMSHIYLYILYDMHYSALFTAYCDDIH